MTSIVALESKPEQHVYRRRGAEEGAIKEYNDTIRLAAEVGDNNTKLVRQVY